MTQPWSRREIMVRFGRLRGGYYLLGVKAPHHRLFQDIAWSTEHVAHQTLERAAELHLPVHVLPKWYDVDDIGGLKMLLAELFEGQSLAPDLCPAPARHTCALIQSLVETSDPNDRLAFNALRRAAEFTGLDWSLLARFRPVAQFSMRELKRWGSSVRTSRGSDGEKAHGLLRGRPYLYAFATLQCAVALLAPAAAAARDLVVYGEPTLEKARTKPLRNARLMVAPWMILAGAASSSQRRRAQKSRRC